MNFASIWDHRGFIVASIKNDFQSRYARSRFGALWMILQPCSQVLIYALILSKVLAAKFPGSNSEYAYVIYLMTGTLVWSLFNEVVTRTLTIFVERASLIKKVQFPRITFPLVVSGSALVGYLILFLLTLLAFLFFGHAPSKALVLMPLLTLLVFAFSLGVGLIVGVMNVFVRDLTLGVPILLQLVFWATPIVYPVSILPAYLQKLLAYNPLCVFVELYQCVLFQGAFPPAILVFKSALFAAVMLSFGYFVFRRANAELVDVL